MQIHLKQLEITAALKMFIASQGINLTGKTVEINFTSGRKDNGLSAEIDIEDAVPSTVIPITRDAKQNVAPATQETSPEPVEEGAPETPAVTKPVSLFSL